MNESTIKNNLYPQGVLKGLYKTKTVPHIPETKTGRFNQTYLYPKVIRQEAMERQKSSNNFTF